MNPNLKTRLTAALAASMLAGASTTSAELLFFENFSGSNFVVGSTVNGVTSNSTGALGQSGNWTIRSGNTVDATIVNSTLSYTNGAISLTGSGKVVSATPTAINQSVTFGVNTDMSTWGPVATPGEVGAGNYLYFSFLWRLESGTSLNYDTTRLGLLNSTNGITGTGNTGYQFGTSNAYQSKFGSTNGSNTFTVPGSPTAPSASTTYLLVGRIGSNGTEFNTFNMWINPTTSDGSDTPYQSYTGLTSTGGITGFMFSYSNIEASDTIRLGDIRVGTTWADVTAVPEPTSAAALAGLAGLGLVGLRRRRRA